ncbi:MAG: hypothetical protein DSM106950_31425 [Stigonema ocellatum SAG 48.90 = DSM 106950]|nr:hypothetical protein [Stigonema ocellatum SAG 48.90 = DSM 106950]
MTMIKLEQWKLEMAERFGLRMDEVNRGKLEEIRRGTELGANPFDYIPLGIASIDFLKQEKILELLERANYDMVVLDEAHHCMDLGAIEEREDSQRRRLAEVLARRCDSLLLLTATPHDGNDREKGTSTSGVDLFRSQEITGTDVDMTIQLSLFDTLTSNQQRLPESNWQSLNEPGERLAGFATDTEQSVCLRSEADGVLRIYRQRVKMLESIKLVVP